MDELAHQIKHAAQQQGDSPRPFVYGHISSYDPKLHRVRVVFPSLRDEADNPVLSSWMPLESHWVGPSWGFQVAPIGGATQQNPTQGEMVQVHFVEHRYGVTSCAKMFFNQVNQPPFTDLKPGEMGMKHQSGSYLKFTNDGNVTAVTHQDLVATVGRDATVTPTRDAVVTAGRNATVAAPSGSATVSGQSVAITSASTLAMTGTSINGGDGGGLHKLMTDTAMAVFNLHTHLDSHGDESGPPQQQMDASDLTAITELQ